MTNLPEDVTQAEATAQTWYSKAVAWVTANPTKVVTGVLVVVALAVWKIL